MIKSYRGQLDAGGSIRISLATPDGKMGYRIIKLATIVDEPAAYDTEATLKIFTDKQDTVTSTIDFSDSSLLGVAYAKTGSSSSEPTPPQTTIFDNTIFNQNIFVTSVEPISSRPNNYLIELEQVKLDENEALVAIVKNLRINQ